MTPLELCNSLTQFPFVCTTFHSLELIEDEFGLLEFHKIDLESVNIHLHSFRLSYKPHYNYKTHSDSSKRQRHPDSVTDMLSLVNNHLTLGRLPQNLLKESSNSISISNSK